MLVCRWPQLFLVAETRVVDPDSFNTDPGPDPAFLFNPDPDPDPEPVPYPDPS
jgi:hypothetical protein